MKCAGWKCSLSLGFVLGTILLGAAPLAGEATPSPAVTPSLLSPKISMTAALLSEPPEPAQTIGEKLKELEQGVEEAKSKGDNAWMLVSAALVLMMTGPGLALFYGGLVRRKNVLGTMMQSFILMAVITVLWAVCGYSLAFGESTPFFGDMRYAFLNGVGADPNTDYAATIP